MSSPLAASVVCVAGAGSGAAGDGDAVGVEGDAAGEAVGAAGDAVGVAGEAAGVTGEAVVVGDAEGGGSEAVVGFDLGFGFAFRSLSLAPRAVIGDASTAKTATAESRISIEMFFRAWCSRLYMIHLRATDGALLHRRPS
jgi:hypothetical protein